MRTRMLTIFYFAIPVGRYIAQTALILPLSPFTDQDKPLPRWKNLPWPLLPLEYKKESHKL
jgi:hypothetical protein